MHETTPRGFHPSDAPAVHRQRRARILAAHPSVRRLYGHDPRTGTITLAVVAAQIAIAAGFSRLAAHRASPGGVPLAIVLALVAYAVGAFLAKWCGVAIHESTHNLVRRTALGNRLVGLVANAPLLVPGAMSFRRYHMQHHRWLGVPVLDEDLPGDVETRHMGRSPLRKILWLALFGLFAALGRDFAKRPDRWELLNVGTQLAIDAALLLTVGWTGLLYLGLSTLFGFGLHPVAAHFVHEHYLWSEGQETYSYYGPLNRLTLNLGYHNEHHDFPRVPSRRLPALHRIARAEYDALVSHDSWTRALWTFVTTTEMSQRSRRVRTREAALGLAAPSQDSRCSTETAPAPSRAA